MSNPYGDYKKRPPPIAIPTWPQSRPTPGPNAFATAQARSDQQHQQSQQYQQQRGASNFASVPAARSVTDPMASLPTQNVSRSGSQGNKSRSSAMTTLSNLMDQARMSPRKSHQSASMPSRRGTTHSKHSEASYHSATAAQAQLEALDAGTMLTTRAQIESRTERKLFKMTGQIPPTPMTGTVDVDSVFIRSQDLRAQCRAASGEKKTEHDDAARSPKKKLFGVSFPTFSRTASHAPAPEMPSKAAQVLGTTPARKPRRVEVRPIKPASPKTPKRVPRADASGALPAKVYEQRQYNRHHNSPGKRRATSRKVSIGKPPGMHVRTSPDSIPPTPPAKDTPPKAAPAVYPLSPLRRAPMSHNLRESYGGFVNKGAQLQLPKFALSPSPQKAVGGTVSGGLSPTKFHPYTADDYTKLIQGHPMQWPYPEPYEPSEFSEPKERGSNRGAPLNIEARDQLDVPRPEQWSGDGVCNAEGSRSDVDLLQPRFYTPSDRSVHMFKWGEGPSTNTDATRMIFTLSPIQRSLHSRSESTSGTIDMIFQGNLNEIDPNSSTAELTKNAVQGSPLQQRDKRDEHALAARAMQELRVSERQLPPPAQAKPDHLQPGASSSMLTGMLNGGSPSAAGTPGTFRPHHPSAVPSPLCKNNGPPIPIQPIMCSPPPAMNLWSSPPSKSIDDHFYMTNEHLDVVGKTTYDVLATFSKDIMATIKSKHENVIGLVEKRVEEVKSQIEFIAQGADGNANRDREIGAKLDELLRCIKNDVAGALDEQGKKTAELEVTVKELRKTVEGLQQSMERVHSQPHPEQAMAPSSAPSFGSYWGGGAIRDVQAAPMPPMQENHNATNTQDAYNHSRAGYGSSYGQQRGHGGGFQGRSGKEERSPYLGTNPYHFGNGGQYSNGYMGGYSYNFSPNPAEQQQQPFGQKPMQ